MKKHIIILVTAVIMILTGCSQDDVNSISQTGLSESSIVQTQSVNTETSEDIETGSDTVISGADTGSAVSQAEEKQSSQNPATNNTSGSASQSKSSAVESSSSQKTDSTQAVPDKTEPVIPVAVATSADSDWIANRVAQLLNEERIAAGVHTRTVLDGLNRIAVYRSAQLVQNFSHTLQCCLCTDKPYGTATINNVPYKTFLMRRSMAVYTPSGTRWGTVAANMLVATNNPDVGTNHNDWKEINYVQQSPNRNWVQVSGTGHTYGLNILALLDTEEQNLLKVLYLSGKPKTEREAAKELGIPQQTLHDRKKRLKKKIIEKF